MRPRSLWLCSRTDTRNDTARRGRVLSAPAAGIDRIRGVGGQQPFRFFFLGLELLSVSLYGLIAYSRAPTDGVEAGLKYLVLAAVSASVLLFGMALTYAQTGTMDFSSLAAWNGPGSIMLLTGLGLIVVGIGFKLALVPFHLWTPDVYQGAPAPFCIRRHRFQGCDVRAARQAHGWSESS